MCEVLTTWARSNGARVHAECSGYDLIIEVGDGRLVGVEAKLRPNLEVVAQATRHARMKRRCEVVAVAVPEAVEELREVCRALELGVFEVWKLDPERWKDDPFDSYYRFGHRDQRRPRSLGSWLDGAPHAAPSERPWVPDVEVMFPAGVPGPKTISPWKIGAAKLCARLRAGETLTRADFVALNVDMKRWVATGWIVGVDGTRPRAYTKGHYLPDVEFPEVAEALGLPRPDRAVLASVDKG